MYISTYKKTKGFYNKTKKGDEKMKIFEKIDSIPPVLFCETKLYRTKYCVDVGDFKKGDYGPLIDDVDNSFFDSPCPISQDSVLIGENEFYGNISIDGKSVVNSCKIRLDRWGSLNVSDSNIENILFSNDSVKPSFHPKKIFITNSTIGPKNKKNDFLFICNEGGISIVDSNIVFTDFNANFSVEDNSLFLIEKSQFTNFSLSIQAQSGKASHSQIVISKSKISDKFFLSTYGIVNLSNSSFCGFSNIRGNIQIKKSEINENFNFSAPDAAQVSIEKCSLNGNVYLNLENDSTIVCKESSFLTKSISGRNISIYAKSRSVEIRGCKFSGASRLLVENEGNIFCINSTFTSDDSEIICVSSENFNSNICDSVVAGNILIDNAGLIECEIRDRSKIVGNIVLNNFILENTADVGHYLDGQELDKTFFDRKTVISAGPNNKKRIKNKGGFYIIPGCFLDGFAFSYCHSLKTFTRLESKCAQSFSFKESLLVDRIMSNAKKVIEQYHDDITIYSLAKLFQKDTSFIDKNVDMIMLEYDKKSDSNLMIKNSLLLFWHMFFTALLENPSATDDFVEEISRHGSFNILSKKLSLSNIKIITDSLIRIFDKRRLNTLSSEWSIVKNNQ